MIGVMKKIIQKENYLNIVLCAMVLFACVGLWQVNAQELPAELTQEEKEAQEKEEKEREEEEEKKEKEDELKKDAKKLEKKLDKAEKEKQEKQRVLNAQYSDLTKHQYELDATKKEIGAKEDAIGVKDAEITALKDQIKLTRATLAATMRQLYFERTGAITAEIYKAGQAEQFLMTKDHIGLLREKAISIMDDLDVQDEKLAESKKILIEAKAAKQLLLTKQQEKEKALKQITAKTTIQVQEVEATISQINGKLAGIQSDLSSLLGVGLSTDDIVEAAEFASKKTGVRKGFLLGMLIVETDLGRFTGGCTYKQSRMNDHRKQLFKKLTKELDYDYKKMKVSCPPSNYKGTGGAMGVAQFMSDTWYGYKDKIAKNTGNNPPDPWNLVDGVMAMALKLANDGATKKSGEWNAAARYLGSCRGNTKFYCENVLYWADNYEKKL